MLNANSGRKRKNQIMAKITINYKTIFVEGNVQIKDGLLYVNGDLFLSLRKFSEDSINITINGDLKAFTIDSCNSLQVNGNVQNIKMESSASKSSNDQGMSFGDEKPFLSKKITEKEISIIINGDLGLLTVETCQSLQINGNNVSLQW